MQWNIIQPWERLIPSHLHNMNGPQHVMLSVISQRQGLNDLTYMQNLKCSTCKREKMVVIKDLESRDKSYMFSTKL